MVYFRGIISLFRAVFASVVQIVQKVTGEDVTLTQVSKNLLIHKKSPFKAMVSD